MASSVSVVLFHESGHPGQPEFLFIETTGYSLVPRLRNGTFHQLFLSRTMDGLPEKPPAGTICRHYITLQDNSTGTITDTNLF